jgi:hypothetical protein
MGSPALSEWNSFRSNRIDDLLNLHGVVGGTKKGRRHNLEELNHALVLKLAAGFQGFARDLHQVASETFAEEASSGNTAVRAMTLKLLTLNRKLDAGNATPSSIGNDFGRLFVNFWPSVRASRAAPGLPAGRAKQIEKAVVHLEALNHLRNAIIHSNPTIELMHGVGLLQGLWRAGSSPIAAKRANVHKTEVVSMRTSLNVLAERMDSLVANEIAGTFQIQAPW